MRGLSARRCMPSPLARETHKQIGAVAAVVSATVHVAGGPSNCGSAWGAVGLTHSRSHWKSTSPNGAGPWSLGPLGRAPGGRS
eukprot:1957726-Pyramimonas_sp.AAC.1